PDGHAPILARVDENPRDGQDGNQRFARARLLSGRAGSASLTDGTVASLPPGASEPTAIFRIRCVPSPDYGDGKACILAEIQIGDHVGQHDDALLAALQVDDVDLGTVRLPDESQLSAWGNGHFGSRSIRNSDVARHSRGA